ncbi:MAG: DEAD/DEAH box helicase [bacterium]
MVNFKSLVKRKRVLDPTNLVGLFNSLDRYASHTELRPAQDQALKHLTDRRSEKDIILKISTGAGKTAVGLLYLYSHMTETEEPALYLCPTVQLVEQVLEEAVKLGIPAFAYPGNEPFPNPEAVAGNALIVCTYAKLFNAKSTFDRSDVLLRPRAIVLDDAHAGVEEIRNKFTLTIVEPSQVQELLSLLSDPCRTLRSGTWERILAGDPYSSLEVPYWFWKPLIPEVVKKLSQYADHESFLFVWPFIRDTLRWCRCIITGRGIEIIPEILLIHKCEAYAKASHRLFMSATLADDSVLIREIGADIEAARNPIVPKKDSGLGERMVLAPSLVDKSLNREYVMKLAAALSKKTNVVVLSPSKDVGREWESVGAKLVPGDEVAVTIRDLRNPKSGFKFVVFAQRYDGVDLPDNACRVLVIDGLPFGEGITDKYDVSLSSTPGGMRNRIVYRIEQGMGRAVRSHVDYAVVILAGSDLANFIAKNEVLKNMNPGTRAQLKLAMDLASLARDESPQDPSKAVVSMINQCLKRDEDWKQYYEEKVRSVKPPHGKTEDARLELASAERKAFHLADSNNAREAVKTLRTTINNFELDDSDKGWYLQRVANYMLDANPEEYLEIQQAAYLKNNSVLCPPSVTIRPPSPSTSDIHSTIIHWLKQFGNPNGAIAAIQDIRARLSYDGSPETLEQALSDLGRLVGALTFRPEKEYGKGPDDLWLWPSTSFVIEAKNQNHESLHKKDAGQLHQSLQWFSENYKTRNGQPIVVAKVALADRNAEFPPDTRVLLPAKMVDLLNNIEDFYQAIIGDLPSSLDPKRIIQQLPHFNLEPDQFVGKYTVRLTEKK